jgi:hypothetical protein
MAMGGNDPDAAASWVSAMAEGPTINAAESLINRRGNRSVSRRRPVGLLPQGSSRDNTVVAYSGKFRLTILNQPLNGRNHR